MYTPRPTKLFILSVFRRCTHPRYCWLVPLVFVKPSCSEGRTRPRPIRSQSKRDGELWYVHFTAERAGLLSTVPSFAADHRLACIDDCLLLHGQGRDPATWKETIANIPSNPFARAHALPSVRLTASGAPITSFQPAPERLFQRIPADGDLAPVPWWSIGVGDPAEADEVPVVSWAIKNECRRMSSNDQVTSNVLSRMGSVEGIQRDHLPVTRVAAHPTLPYYLSGGIKGQVLLWRWFDEAPVAQYNTISRTQRGRVGTYSGALVWLQSTFRRRVSVCLTCLGLPDRLACVDVAVRCPASQCRLRMTS